jgi:DNA-binding NtrC family response regulator
MSAKLLLVDDNRHILKCFSICAGKYKGFDVSTASSANQALDMEERQGPFDVIISDYFMPGMNGIELLRRMQKQRPESQRFIMSTSAGSNYDSNEVLNAIDDGVVSRFFPKPMLVADIDVMLNDALAPTA